MGRLIFKRDAVGITGRKLAFWISIIKTKRGEKIVALKLVELSGNGKWRQTAITFINRRQLSQLIDKLTEIYSKL